MDAGFEIPAFPRLLPVRVSEELDARSGEGYGAFQSEFRAWVSEARRTGRLSASFLFYLPLAAK